MEFLQQFMKNRNTVGNPTSPLEESKLVTLPCEESQLEEFDIPPSDEPRIEATNDGEPTEPAENVARKDLKNPRLLMIPLCESLLRTVTREQKRGMSYVRILLQKHKSKKN